MQDRGKGKGGNFDNGKGNGMEKEDLGTGNIRVTSYTFMHMALQATEEWLSYR